MTGEPTQPTSSVDDDCPKYYLFTIDQLDIEQLKIGLADLFKVC